MLFDSIKRNIFAIITCCTVILLLFWGGRLLYVSADFAPTLPTNAMPLQKLVLGWFYTQSWTAVLAGAVLTLITGILLYRLNEVHLFISKREPLLPIIFVLLMSVFGNTHYLQGIHIALFFIILSFDTIFHTYRRDYAFREIFMAALYLSAATLFYAPASYLLLLLIIGLNLLKPISWRDWVVLMAGLTVPYIFALFFCFLTQVGWETPFLSLADNLTRIEPLNVSELSASQWVYTIYVACITFVAIVHLLFIPTSGTKIKAIRINGLFIWMFIITLFCTIFYSSANNDVFLITVLPITVLMVNLLSTIRSNAKANGIFVVLLLLIIAMQIPAAFYETIASIATDAWEFVINLF